MLILKNAMLNQCLRPLKFHLVCSLVGIFACQFSEYLVIQSRDSMRAENIEVLAQVDRFINYFTLWYMHSKCICTELAKY